MEPRESFGYWLRRRRKAHDLTQEALAGLAGCTTATIKRIEADERRPSRELAMRFANVLSIPADERELFIRVARGERRSDALELPSQPLGAAPVGVPSNLPAAPNALIGREQELAVIGALLRRPHTRLVTLTGPGGVGKTRLALAVAERLRSEFPSGVWFVDLASLRDPALVLPSIAYTLGLQEHSTEQTSTQLASFLRQRRLLLVLDNLEQLLAAAPELAALLAAAPDLKLLATSRVALNLRAEHEVAVEPLALAANARQSPAVQLFVDRAQAARHTFALDDDNAGPVADICRRVDGLPLAIELVAAQIRWLSPEVMARQLAAPLDLLVRGPGDLPARQQTLRATIAWSYELLAPTEQALFARLAIFQGGWSLESASAIVTGDGVVESAQLGAQLGALVGHNLVRALPNGLTPRFQMLETIHAYASDQLAAHGVVGALGSLHARYFCALAEDSVQGLRGANLLAWLHLVDAEHDNLRAAISWALREQPALALPVATALSHYWSIRGYAQEGADWIEQALAAAPEAPADLRARALTAAAMVNSMLGRYRRSDEQIAASLGLWEQLGLRQSSADVAWTLIRQAVNAWSFHSDYQAQGDLAREAYTIAERAGDRWMQGRALAMEAGAMAHRGDPAGAARANERVLAFFEPLGDQIERARALYHIAVWGDFSPAERRQRLEAAIALERSSEHLSGELGALNALGELARSQGEWERAAEAYGTILELSRRCGDLGFEKTALDNLLLLAVQSGDLPAGARWLHERLAQEPERSPPVDQWNLFMYIATLAGAMSKPVVCAQLQGYCEGLTLAERPYVASWDESLFEQTTRAARGGLGDAGFRQAYEAGKGLTQEAAYALARELLGQEAASRRVSGRASPP